MYERAAGLNVSACISEIQARALIKPLSLHSIKGGGEK
jgi:hypothetical protein